MLWKSWRDLRLFVWIGLSWLGVVVAAVVYAHLRGFGEAHIATTGHASRVAPEFVAGLASVQMAFVLLAWSMGTVGIGRDLGHGAGSWMLTRPTPRGRFVWTEWASGLTVLALLLALAEFLWWLALRLHIFYFVVETPNPPYLFEPRFPFGLATIASLCVFAFLALIFSITHCGTVSLRNSTRGLLFCLGFLIAWAIVAAVIRYHGPAWMPRLPNLFLTPTGEGGFPLAYRPHLASSILERFAVLPIFPLLAHVFLRRAEV
ncbi:MAG: hypothetical protein WBW84_20430 [Acidobacteriaceae bacterium]